MSESVSKRSYLRSRCPGDVQRNGENSCWLSTDRQVFLSAVMDGVIHLRDGHGDWLFGHTGDEGE